MRKKIAIVLAAFMAAGTCAAPVWAQESAVVEEAQEAHVVEACIVTEVLEWGETVTGVRIEYDDEIWSGAIRHDRYFQSYGTSDTRDISYVYVNNSGKPNEFEAYGKYVFLHFDNLTENGAKYLEQVAFNEATGYREKLDTINVWQNHDIETASEKIVKAVPGYASNEGMCISASTELRTDVDKFTYVPFKTEEGLTETPIEFGYLLYVPEGYEAKSEDLENVPLVVHFPSGDYANSDFTGQYTGALYRHPDATVWASDAVQEEHPCFVVTIAANQYLRTNQPEIADWMEETYVEMINEIASNYNVDLSRIYGCSIGGGGTNLYNVALKNPEILAGYLMAGFDPLYAESWIYGDNDLERVRTNVEMMADTMNMWFFAGYYDPHGTASDPSGEGMGTGERMVKYGKQMIDEGLAFDYGFGEKGELMWNALLKGADAQAQAEEQIARAEANGLKNMITIYMPNTIPADPHWSWSHAFTNKGVQEWLFDQVNDAPYTIGE